MAQFRQGVLRSVQLQPIELGLDLPAAQRGLPRLANPELSKQILARVAGLSQIYGTRIQIGEGKGFISVSAPER